MTVTLSKLWKDVGKQKLAAEREGLTFTTMTNWAAWGWFEIHTHTNLERKYYCPTETTLEQTSFISLRGLRMKEKNHCNLINLLHQLGQKSRVLWHTIPLLRALNHIDLKSAKIVRVHPGVTAHSSYVRLAYLSFETCVKSHCKVNICTQNMARRVQPFL